MRTRNTPRFLPHFPRPRLENAATIAAGLADAIEMQPPDIADSRTGIDPACLVDWYRYLNCGYFIPITGGSDKMSAATTLGGIRTYTKLAPGELLSDETWQNAVRRGHNFATVGPLIDISIGALAPGAVGALPRRGGTLALAWRVESLVMPVTKLVIVINGVILEEISLERAMTVGSFDLHFTKSSWVCAFVRAKAPDGAEVIAAHTSPIAIKLEGSHFMAAADASTILEQIEGSVAYVDNGLPGIAPATHRRMRLRLEGIYRDLHNRMHSEGVFHDHAAPHHHHD
jgi:hypothetical protein